LDDDENEEMETRELRNYFLVSLGHREQQGTQITFSKFLN